MRRTHRYAAVAGVLLAVIGLGACSVGRPHSDTSAGTSSTGTGGGSPKSAPGSTGEGAPEPAVGADDAVRSAPRPAAVVRTGEVWLTSPHLAQVRAAVDDLLRRVGGRVDDEHTTNDSRGRTRRSTLVLRVPAARFDAAKQSLERLGTLKSATESAEDVTTQVIDTAERVQTLQNSLDRLQRFQRRARDVGDLIRYEDEITQRQSELQSLTAQRDYLADRTTMATITVQLSTPAAYVAPRRPLDRAGFVAGLTSGWHALVGLVVVALTVLGALLPFLVVGLLLGVPVWVAVRRLLRRRRGDVEPEAG